MDNKSLILTIYDLCTKKDLDTMFEYYHPTYIEHARTGDAPLEKLKQTSSMFLAAFPDASWTVENMVSEGDRVAYQVIIRGTHKGRFMGIDPTENKIEMYDTSIKRIVDGKLIESWGTIDSLSLMQQIGIIPKR